MAQALLSPEQLAPSDEECGHAVTQAVQRGPGDLGPPGKLGDL